MVLQNQKVRPGSGTAGFDRNKDLETRKRIHFGVDTLFLFSGLVGDVSIHENDPKRRAK
jgi:hypothetical protein